MAAETTGFFFFQFFVFVFRFGVFMAASVTLDEMVSRLESATDTANDTFFSTTEKRDFIRVAVAETWDKIVSAGLSDKGVKSVNFTATSGTLEYPVATVCPDGDFYKVSALYVVENASSGLNRPIERINPAEVYGYRPPQGSVSMKLYYIPTAPTFKVAGVYDGAATFDGINGWEEHSIATAAMAMMKKKDDDWQKHASRKAELEQRIAQMASSDYSGPSRVVRRRRGYGRFREPFWAGLGSGVTGWNIRGDKLELYSYVGVLPV